MSKVIRFDADGEQIKKVSCEEADKRQVYCRSYSKGSYTLMKKGPDGRLETFAQGDLEYITGCMALDVQKRAKVTGKVEKQANTEVEAAVEVKADIEVEAPRPEEKADTPVTTLVTSTYQEDPGDAGEWDDWEPEDPVQESEKLRTSVVQAILRKLPKDSKLDRRLVGRHLAVCQCRNRKHEGYRKHIINTRLTDSMGQPLYILDYDAERGTEEKSSLQRTTIVFSLAEAVKLLEERGQVCNCDALPPPIQWSTSPSDYQWDWTTPIASIQEKSLDHVLKDRIDRIPPEYHQYSKEILTRFVRAALNEGKEWADRDASYALPMYSAKHDVVSMLLPWYLFSPRNGLPDAVFVMHKDWQGYHLRTIITPEMVYDDIRIFMNPENTWLRGAGKQWK